MTFKRPRQPEYQPLRQRQDAPTNADNNIPEENIQEETQQISNAELVVNEFEKTLEFTKWLTGLVDDKVKDIVVQVDPEQHPQVWEAMRRLFGDSANTNLSGRAYLDVLDALRQVNQIELDESQSSLDIENQFIAKFDKSGEAEDHETPEIDDLDEDEIALEEAVAEKRFTGETDEEAKAKERAKRYKKLWKNRFLRRRKIWRYRFGKLLGRSQILKETRFVKNLLGKS